MKITETLPLSGFAASPSLASREGDDTLVLAARVFETTGGICIEWKATQAQSCLLTVQSPDISSVKLPVF